MQILILIAMENTPYIIILFQILTSALCSMVVVITSATILLEGLIAAATKDTPSAQTTEPAKVRLYYQKPPH